MKHNLKILKRYAPWLTLLLGIDGLAALLLWLADTQAFHAMIVVIFLATVLLFFAVCWVLTYRERRKEKAFFAFIHNPDEYHEELLLKTVSDAEANAIQLLGATLRENTDTYNQLKTQLSDYEEYVEAWVHEAKTPLSLLTLLLDNRRDELPETTGIKLDYIRNRMQESIEHMLYYARLKGARKDYLFEHISVRLCIEELLEDYRPLLDEKHFCTHMQIFDSKVYTDRRGFRFLLGQVISNAIKYSSKEPELYFEFVQEEQSCMLSIRDNGIGVRSCDLPYIFEKGFTGDSGEGRKKATGMGLYLAKEIANDLHLSLNVLSEWGKEFEMQITFPVIND